MIHAACSIDKEKDGGKIFLPICQLAGILPIPAQYSGDISFPARSVALAWCNLKGNKNMSIYCTWRYSSSVFNTAHPKANLTGRWKDLKIKLHSTRMKFFLICRWPTKLWILVFHYSPFSRADFCRPEVRNIIRGSLKFPIFRWDM